MPGRDWIESTIEAKLLYSYVYTMLLYSFKVHKQLLCFN